MLKSAPSTTEIVHITDTSYQPILFISNIH